MEHGHSEINELQIFLQSATPNIKENDVFNQIDCHKDLQEFLNSKENVKMVDMTAISLIPSEENPNSEEQKKWIQKNISELFPTITSSQK